MPPGYLGVDLETAAAIRLNEKLHALMDFCKRNGISFRDVVRESIAKGIIRHDSPFAVFAK